MKDYIGKNISANLFRGVEAVGGKIFFESTCLIFKSHEYNIQTGETSIDYKQIDTIENTKTLGVVPNGILITTKDDIKYRFVVNNRSKIINFIEEMM